MGTLTVKGKPKLQQVNLYTQAFKPVREPLMAHHLLFSVAAFDSDNILVV